MSIKYGKTQVEKMIDAIDQDHESAEAAALAALAVAEELLEERAKFVIIGKLASTKEKPFMSRNDPESTIVALGYYSTPGDAQSAAESLWHNTGSGDVYRTAVVPMFYGTPADLHKKKKEQYEKEEAGRAEAQLAKFRKSIEDQKQYMLDRAKGGSGSCETCRHQPFDHTIKGVSRGECRVPRCECEKWIESKRKPKKKEKK